MSVSKREMWLNAKILEDFLNTEECLRIFDLLFNQKITVARAREAMCIVRAGNEVELPN